MRQAVMIGAMFLAACAERGPMLPVPQVTTLPNGVVEVKNSGPSAWADTSGWRLVEVYRVGGAGAEGDGELVNPQSIALGADGGLYVADQQPPVIKQYGPDGTFLRKFGREGSGPGEFRVGFIATAPGVLVLHDPRESRTTVFDSAGTFLRSWPSSCCYWSSIVVTRDTLIHVPTGSIQPDAAGPDRALPRRHYLRYRLDGTLVDTMTIQNPGKEEPAWTLTGGTGNDKFMMSTSVPLAASATWALDPAGGAIAAWSEDYRFVVSRTGMDTVQLVSLAATAPPISDARRQHIRDSMVTLYTKQFGAEAVEDAFKVSDIPSVAPMFDAIEVDGRRYRWVRRDDGGVRASARFDVFDSTGAYLGAVPVPLDFGSSWSNVWGEDLMATSTEDADGLPVVVMYRIERQVRKD